MASNQCQITSADLFFNFFLPQNHSINHLYSLLPRATHYNLCVWCLDIFPELWIVKFLASRCSELIKVLWRINFFQNYIIHQRVLPNTEAILFGTRNATTAMGFLNWRCHEVSDLCVFERSCISISHAMHWIESDVFWVPLLSANCDLNFSEEIFSCQGQTTKI